MRLSACRSCLVAGAKPRRVLPRAGAITSRFESLEKLWRRRDERTPFGPSRRDSNPCFSLERASPWIVISPTSTPGATARCHLRWQSAARMPSRCNIGQTQHARTPLSANMSETATPWKFSVEGEQGSEADERSREEPGRAGDRGRGEAGAAAVHPRVQAQGRTGGGRL